MREFDLNVLEGSLGILRGFVLKVLGCVFGWIFGGVFGGCARSLDDCCSLWRWVFGGVFGEDAVIFLNVFDGVFREYARIVSNIFQWVFGGVS